MTTASLSLRDWPQAIGTSYRPVPFWSWNEKLEPEELRRQVREMHSAGLGAFFMHARGGLQTAYLSPEWMACVEACLDEAGKLGMKGWLYDENGWPSGFGGGLVNGLGEYYQQKYLRFQKLDIPAAGAYADGDSAHTIAFYDAASWKLLGRALPEDFTGTALRAYMEINPYYVDNLDAKVVAEFIRVTHQHYYDTLPKVLQQHLGGIFSDEPQLSRNGNLWSLVLEREYRGAYGRELLEELPAMQYDDFPGASAVRCRFWRLCARLFRDNFMKQIRQWCDARGWGLTGHHVLEETCQSQLSSNGSIMAQYQYYTIPGMDMLCRRLPSAVAMTQLESAAAQFGQRQVLTESFALTGWNCNFSGQRFVYHPQLAHGINLLCEHLEGYSLRGLRKRDYPASAFYHQPWWKDYRRINDYFSGIGKLLATGEAECSVLVVHPLSSAWCLYDGNDRKATLPYYTRELLRLTERLDELHVAHHYADEVICEDCGSCRDGRILIGNCAYGQVVIPPLRNLSAKMLALLQEFRRAGGSILRIRNTQDADMLTIDGEEASATVRQWIDALPMGEEATAAAEMVASAMPERLRTLDKATGADATSVASTMRRFKSLDGRAGRLYFVTNLRYDEPLSARVSFPADAAGAEVLDPATGTLTQLPVVRTAEGRLEADYYFGGADAALFFLPDTANDGAVSAPAPLLRQWMERRPCRTLPVHRMRLRAASENLLTLDNCRYRVDGGQWQECAVISLQARLLQLQRDCHVELEFPFMVAEDFDVTIPLTMLVETPWRFTFALNGVPFDNADHGYCFDKAFRRVTLPKALRAGRNIISMSLTYHQPESLYARLEAARKFETEYNKLTFDTELESIYLLGDFAVRHTGAVETLPRESLRFNGDFAIAPSVVGAAVDGTCLERAGMPFFAGEACLEVVCTLTAAEADAIRAVRFTPAGANSWRCLVNGKEAGFCAWQPYILPVKGLLKAGENTIAFTLTTSLRNLLGPHHMTAGECWAVSTISFNREPTFTGVAAPATCDGYCVVKNGLGAIELL